MSNIVAKRELLMGAKVKQELAIALPENMQVDTFVRIAITTLTKNEKLAKCTDQSIMMCLLELSSLGLAPDNRHAHLIPFKETCTLVIDYKGLVQIVRRDPNVTKVEADVIKENDDYEISHGQLVHHSYKLGNRGSVIGAFAAITKTDGTKQYEIMEKAEIDKIKENSNAYKSAKNYNKPSIWDEHYDEMCKKTAFRRLTKWLDLSSTTNEQIAKVDKNEFEERNVTPNPKYGNAQPIINDPSSLDDVKDHIEV